MYFITPSDPKIILFGINETQIYGFGEKNGKLCIYSKAIFDIGEWKEFYEIDINVVKCDVCNGGIHVAGGVCLIDQIKTIGIPKKPAIWIAAREDKYTHIFSINIATKQFTRYEMLQETYPEFALINLNLCSRCLNPIIRRPFHHENFVFLVIVPQKYQENVGIFRILVSINHPEQKCLMWKKVNSFILIKPPLASITNILMDDKAEQVLSVIQRSTEDGRIKKLSIETNGTINDMINFSNNNNDFVWHEIAFCDGFFITRRKEEDGNKSVLWIYGFKFPDIEGPIGLCPLDYCSMNENFPSIESSKFYITWRIVDKEYITKTNTKVTDSKLFAIPSMITLQTIDGSIVTIPLRILSLSELAYLSLARIPQSHPLPQIHTLFGQSKQEINRVSWMTQDFIKAAIGWPRILPLTKAAKLPKK